MPQMKVIDIPVRHVQWGDDPPFMRYDFNEIPNEECPMSVVKPDRIIWYQWTAVGWWAVGAPVANVDARKLETEYQAHLAVLVN